MFLVDSLVNFWNVLPLIHQIFLVATGILVVLSGIFGVRMVLEPIFGDFPREELLKFVLLGLIFSLIIGVYWTLKPLKDALFQDIIGTEWQPRAKWLSMIVIFPLVIIYSKMVERLSRTKLFYAMSFIYGSITLVIAALFFHKTIGLENLTQDPSRILGWVWYVFVESFGSLIVASLFWAFATDITSAESARKGFFLVIMCGQLVGIWIPLVTRVPKIFGVSNAYSVVICGLLIFMLIPLVWFFMRTVPPEQLKGFGEKEERAPEEKKEEHGFLERLILMLSKPYLLGIFGIISFYEIIMTVFDYYFKTMTSVQYLDKAEKLAFLGEYAQYIMLGTFLCLALSISNIQKMLSLTAALTLMPILVAVSVFVFRFYPALKPLFWLMVLSKSVNYGLNSPSIKQLYIPTTRDVRYKAQAWIESIGSRGSKAAGSLLNDQHKRVMLANGPEWADPAFRQANLFKEGVDINLFWYMALSSYFFVGILVLWVFVALYLGRTYQKAVDENKVVC